MEGYSGSSAKVDSCRMLRHQQQPPRTQAIHRLDVDWPHLGPEKEGDEAGLRPNDLVAVDGL